MPICLIILLFEQTAALYFKEATKQRHNYGADMQYADCMMKLYDHFDYIAHLHSMLDKFKSSHYEQQLYLHIAMQYHAVKEPGYAAINFFKAIQIDPDSTQLKVKLRLCKFATF